MIIIGIDPGTAITGYGILNFVKNKPLKVIAYGVISTPANTEMSGRLLTLYTEMGKLLEKHKPKEIVIERIFFNTNVKTALSVGQARGVIMLAAEIQKIPLFEYTALQAKLVLTGYGRATKKEMQLAVPKYLKMEGKIKQDDAADGLAMAITHLVKIHKYVHA